MKTRSRGSLRGVPGRRFHSGSSPSSPRLHDRQQIAATRADSVRAGRDRWLLSYADLVTLLLACFTTAYAAAQAAPPQQPATATTASLASVGDTSAVVPNPTIVALPLEKDVTTAKRSVRNAIAPIVVAAIGGSHVEFVEDHRGLVISLPESATFPTGSAALTTDAKAFLATLADALRSTDALVRVEGHTDDVPLNGGRYGTNWELSTARASAVVLFLISEGSFAPERLSAAGYGEFHPRVPNASPEARARNRRIDIVILESSGTAR